MGQAPRLRWDGRRGREPNDVPLMRRRRRGCVVIAILTVALLLTGCGLLEEELLGDGYWEVGVDLRRPPSRASGLPPDRYVFDFKPTEQSNTCYWAARGEGGSAQSQGRVAGPGRVRILVPSDTHELELRGCGGVDLGGLEGPDAVPYPSHRPELLGDGVWRVGVDLPAVLPGTTNRYVLTLPRLEEPYECEWNVYVLEGQRGNGDRFSIYEWSPSDPFDRSTEREIAITESIYELELLGCGEHDFSLPQRY